MSTNTYSPDFLISISLSALHRFKLVVLPMVFDQIGTIPLPNQQEDVSFWPFNPTISLSNIKIKGLEVNIEGTSIDFKPRIG